MGNFASRYWIPREKLPLRLSFYFNVTPRDMLHCNIVMSRVTRTVGAILLHAFKFLVISYISDNFFFFNGSSQEAYLYTNEGQVNVIYFSRSQGDISFVTHIRHLFSRYKSDCSKFWVGVHNKTLFHIYSRICSNFSRFFITYFLENTLYLFTFVSIFYDFFLKYTLCNQHCFRFESLSCLINRQIRYIINISKV